MNELLLHNCSVTDSPVDRNEYKYVNVLWLAMGIALVVVNALIVINIFRHRMLRAKKEYLLLAGLVGSDLLLGVATGVDAVFQIVIMSEGRENIQVKQSDCVSSPHFLITAFAGPVEAGMMFVVSFDRLLAILLPLKYCTFTRLYAISMVGICYGCGVVYVIFLHLYALIPEDTDPTINAICFLPKMHRIYGSTYYLRVTFSVLSVAVYAVVVDQFRRHRRRMTSNFPSMKSRLRSAQRRLTVTVGICALLTFCLYVMPTLLAAVHVSMSTWVHAGWALINLNAMLNAFVYSLRHEDIRRGLKLLFTCGELPSVAEQRLRKESQSSMSATGRAAMLTICTLGYARSTRANSATTSISMISITSSVS